jgi:nitroreductase
MTPGRSILAVIKQRSSCRTYLPQLLQPQHFAALETFLTQLTRAPFPGTWRFRLIPVGGPAGVSGKIGTYGSITQAPAFVAGVIQADDRAMLNYGYLLEKIILEATALGLGTCWLGGAFHRADFAGSLACRPGERLPAVTPVGYPAGAEQRSVQDQVLRFSAKSKTRKPFNQLFFEGNFQTPVQDENAVGGYGSVLEAVRRAPSASNRQPWRIMKAENFYHLYLQRNVLYGQVAKLLMNTDDLQLIDIGIAMCHFELAAQELHLKGGWVVKDPGIKPLPAATSYVVSWEGR